jgi:uncharacterized protein YndB with AHSA1/START domain
MAEMDEVFKALNDGGRRRLLDELFERDGQTLGELCAYLPEMTRFGVMNHLRVLEAAGLVTTRRDGRSKLHYLNAVPIRLVHDRWISKYTEPQVGALSRLKAGLEGEATVSKPTHIYQVFINVEPKLVWQAIVDGDLTQQYFYGTRVESTWEPGADLRYLGRDGEVVADGTVVTFDPPHRLEMTFHARWDPELEAEGPVREAWLLDDANGATKLTVELYDAQPGSKTYEEFTGGFPYIVSGLKSLLETGKTLPAPS